MSHILCSMNMTLNQINYLNIFLMVAAAAIAYIFPFEMIVFSYAFLGPAHYLTQISWLHNRDYFTTGKYDYSLLAVLTIPVTFPLIFGSTDVGIIMLLIALFSAGAMALIKDKIKKLVTIGLLAILVLAIYNVKVSAYLYLFIPTLIHVFVFTGAFILVGFLKRKSLTGAISFVVFILCALSFFIVNPDISPYEGSRKTYEFLPFMEHLQAQFIEVFQLKDNWTTSVAVMGFVSYAYTYHYLNWFSKTKVIGWHEISMKRAAGIILLYIVAVGFYLYDYNLGFMVLLYLSVLHVVLEFPLNYVSFVTIGSELKKLALPKTSSA